MSFCTKPFARNACLASAVMLATFCTGSNEGPWRPSGQHRQIAIWPEAIPDAQPVAGPERASPVKDEPVAGKPWTQVENVSRPTMTVYPAKRNTGAAVVVFPGGGYKILAIDLEGTEVCDRLSSMGVTAILLKYRVPDSGPHWERKLKREVVPPVLTALEDAQRTIGLLRFHAAEFGIDPHKIGVLGFSAGGHLVAVISNQFRKRLYPRVDPADDQSCRPDFAIAVYPGHLWTGHDGLKLNPHVHVTRKTPPTFLLQAEDDPVDSVKNSLSYFMALKEAGAPVEMHLFAHGGHAFGLRPTRQPITHWPDLVQTWLRTIDVLKP